MKKGEKYTGKVRELAFPNKGIACVDGVDVIVKNTLPGQEISFILNKNKPGLKEGRLEEILKRSDIETEDGCSVCRRCGGCVYQTIPYEEELAIKNKMVRDILEKAFRQHSEAGISLDRIYEGITGSPEVKGYRNKMEFSFGNEVKDGPLTLGMHVSGHFMDVIDTPDCNIVDADFRMIRDYVSAYARNHGLPFYHRYSNTGLLRNLLVRKGINTGEILVDIVTTSETLLDEEEFARGILSMPLHGKLAGALHTLNDGVADAVKNDSTSVIYGRDYIFDEVLGLRFKISIFSFFQTNTHGAELLYSKVREYVELASANASQTDRGEKPETGDIGAANAIVGARGIGATRGIGVDRDIGAARGIGVVYDLYSGTGTIAQLMSDVASRVYGVEIVPEAVEAAGVNAGLNHIGNVEFICGDVLKVLDDLTEKPDLIILDPPRDGVNPKALKKILEYGVQNIVYISCKITSLARDLHPILDAGYRPVRISVTDMFPKTANVESCVLLERVSNRKADSYVKLNVKMEDYYRIKDAEGGEADG